MKKKVSLLLALLLALSLFGCGARKSASTAATTPSMAPAYDNGYYVEAPATTDSAYWGEAEAGYEYSESKGTSPNAALPAGVKMIYTADMQMQSTEFDRATSDLATLVEQLGGYFETRTVRNYSSGYRYAYYTVRVPSAQFRAFLTQAGELCHVVECTENADDITEQYYDVDSRLKTAQTKLERLQELLAKAETMEDIITIESAISDTEYTIEWLSGELRHYDALVDYSTINISLNEVYKLTETEEPPMTFGAKLGRAFREGIENFMDGLGDLAEWLAYNWLPLLVFIAIVVVVVRLIRKGRAGGRKLLRRRKDKNAPPSGNEGEESK